MQFTQIASDGRLLPFPIKRHSFELWPAKRREVIIDVTRYQDGIPTTKGDVIYLTNVMKMPNGRKFSCQSLPFEPLTMTLPSPVDGLGTTSPPTGSSCTPSRPRRPCLSFSTTGRLAPDTSLAEPGDLPLLAPGRHLHFRAANLRLRYP
jgi:hypothetical protein